MFKPINIIIVIFVLIWAIPTAYVFHDRINLLTSAQSLDASIVSCDKQSRKRRGYRTSPRRSGVTFKKSNRSARKYAPVAVSAEGYKVTGKIFIAGKKNCERRLGQQVKILVDADNPDNARINSFMQFWIYPVALVFAGAMLFCAIIMSSGLFTLLFITAGIIIGGGVYHEIKGFGPAKALPPPIIVDNELAWNVCLTEARKAAMLDSNTQLKRVACKDRGITDLSPISALTQLEYIDVRMNKITSLLPLNQLQSLRELELDSNRQLRTLGGLEGLKSLETLSVRSVSLDNIKALSTIPSLKELDFNNNGLTDISPLSNLPNIVIANLDDNPDLSDISALANKSELEVVTIYGTQVSDLTPLYTSPKLWRIHISNKSTIPCEQIKHIEQNTAEKLQGISGLKRCN